MTYKKENSTECCFTEGNKFLTLRNESRLIDETPLKELNAYITKFIITVQKKDSDEYHGPSSLHSLMASFEWYLKKKNYGISIMKDVEFEQARKLSTVSECFMTTVHSAGSAADYQQGQQAMSIFTSPVIYDGQFNISSAALIN